MRFRPASGSGGIELPTGVIAVPVVARTLRKVKRSLRRWYAFACARDDARRFSYRVPTGVWACADCRFVSLDPLGFRRHMVIAHAG